MHAVHENAEGAVQVLLESGAGVDSRAASGRTALIMAAGYGQEAIVHALLSHGADPDARANDGTNALWAAAGGGAVTDVTDGPPIGSCFPEVVNLLLHAAPHTRLPEGYATGAIRWLARSENCKETIASLTAE